MKSLVVAGAAGAVTMFVSSIAGATPQATCEPLMFPRPSSQAAATLTVPANLPAFGYRNQSATAADLQLTRVAAVGPREDIALDVGSDSDGRLLKVVPKSPLMAGQRYELAFALSDGQDTKSCAHHPSQTPMDLDVVAAAPLPTTLGELHEPPQVIFGSNGATLTIRYRLSDEMKPWASLFTYRPATERHEGYHDVYAPIIADGILETRVTIACNNFNPGKQHTISLTARLPFTPSITTPATPLEFECVTVDYSSPESSNDGSDRQGGSGSDDDGSPRYEDAPRDDSKHTASCSIARNISPFEDLPSWTMMLGLFFALGLCRRSSRR